MVMNNRSHLLQTHWIKRSIAGLLALCTLMGLPASYANAIDQIAVIVNNEVIMQSEITQQAQLLRASEQKAKGLPQQALLQAATDQLIIERLQIQFAKQNNLNVSEAIVDEAMQRIASQNNMNLPTFQAALKRQGIDYLQFRTQTRNKILIDNLRKRQASQGVNISKQEVNELLSTRGQSQAGKTRYQLEHVLLPAPNGTSIPQLNAVRQQAVKLRQQILAGENFQSLTANIPNKQSTYQGWQEGAALPNPAIRALALLEPGELSPVVRDAQGFHLFRLVNRQGGDNLQQGGELSNQATNLIGGRKLDEYYRAWLQSLRNGAFIDYRLEALKTDTAK